MLGRWSRSSARGLSIVSPPVVLSGEVECDEFSVMEGSKAASGHPREATWAALPEARYPHRRGIAAENQPDLRNVSGIGDVVIWILENVGQVTIPPLMRGSIPERSMVDIFARDL